MTRTEAGAGHEGSGEGPVEHFALNPRGSRLGRSYELTRRMAHGSGPYGRLELCGRLRWWGRGEADGRSVILHGPASSKAAIVDAGTGGVLARFESRARRGYLADRRGHLLAVAPSPALRWLCRERHRYELLDGGRVVGRWLLEERGLRPSVSVDVAVEPDLPPPGLLAVFGGYLALRARIVTAGFLSGSA
jgi:hypothetical protein